MRTITRWHRGWWRVLAGGVLCAGTAHAAGDAAPAPRAYTYRVVDGDSLHAFVFFPAGHERDKPVPAILLFHGGGWVWGSPEWVYPAAERFAGYGLVAIAVEYRLSEGDVTPVDALDDVCRSFAWARERADELGITGKCAGYGVSAGGHLVTAAATIGCDGARPDALLLWSPAIDVAADGWFNQLLQGRGDAADYSPLEHVTASTPPVCIVQGAEDTVTPLSVAMQFCDQVTQAGGVCELNVYAGVGHLLTRNLANQEDDFDPDPEKRADGIEKHRAFLARMGLIPAAAPGAGANSSEKAFSGFYVGAEVGSENIVGGAFVDGVDYLAQDSRVVFSLAGGFRYQSGAGFVVGAEGSYGFLDGDLTLSDPDNGLGIDYQNSTQITYGLIAGYALGSEQTWLAFGYASEAKRNFDVTIQQFGTTFQQQDEQGMLRYGVGVEKRIRAHLDVRATAGTGRADFGDKQTNIDIENKFEYAVGVVFQF